MRALLVTLLGSLLVISFGSPSSAAMSTWERMAVDQVNAERRAAGLGANTAQSCLERYAEAHSARMASQRRMHHQTTAQLQTVLKQCGLRWVGENVATGTNMTPSVVVRAWMGSAGHRKNILYPSSNRIGSAYSKGSDGKNYWIHLYGRA